MASVQPGAAASSAPAPAAPAPAAPKPAIQAKLILIKGEGFEGVSYKLSTQEHVIGRLEGTIIYPEDHYLSPHHANLYYENDKLYLRDEGSVNGVFIKLKEPIELQDGDHFLTGEQLLRFDRTSSYQPTEGLEKAADDDTKFYGCPPEDHLNFKIAHIFRDSGEGTVFYAPGDSATIGREQCDLSFPFDRHISGRHARVYLDGGRCFLQDLGSKNGTFFRLNAPRALSHGDYFFVGQQLMRVEITPS